jgi:hypothetical protein
MLFQTSLVGFDPVYGGDKTALLPVLGRVDAQVDIIGALLGTVGLMLGKFVVGPRRDEDPGAPLPCLLLVP